MVLALDGRERIALGGVGELDVISWLEGDGLRPFWDGSSPVVRNGHGEHHTSCWTNTIATNQC